MQVMRLKVLRYESRSNRDPFFCVDKCYDLTCPCTPASHVLTPKHFSVNVGLFVAQYGTFKQLFHQHPSLADSNGVKQRLMRSCLYMME